MKRKHLLSAISAFVGVCLLSGSLIAVSASSSGYASIKNSVKDIIMEENNFTSKSHYEVSLNGKVMSSTDITEKISKDDLVKYNRMYKNLIQYSLQDGMSLYVSDYNDNGIIEPENHDYIRIDDESGPDDLTQIGMFAVINKEEAASTVRFLELAADAVVGDLKNNIILTDSDSDSVTYTMSLDSYQIPELVNAGLSVMLSTGRGYKGSRTDSMQNMTRDERLEYMEKNYISFDEFIDTLDIRGVNMTAVLDNEGRLLGLNGNVNIAAKDVWNDIHELVISADMEISDYDSTVCERMDLSDYAPEVIESRLEDHHNSLVKSLESELKRVRTDKNVSEEEREEFENHYNSVMSSFSQADYDRCIELRDKLLYGSPSDEERQAMVNERADIIEKNNF